MKQPRMVSPAEYQHGRYGLYGAFSIVSTLVVAGFLVLINLTGLVLAILASRR